MVEQMLMSEREELVLKALACRTRLRILLSLNHGPRCVGAMARSIGVSEAAVSQHLSVLKNAGLVTGLRDGNHVHYTACESGLEPLRDLLELLQSASAGRRAACEHSTGGTEGRTICAARRKERSARRASHPRKLASAHRSRSRNATGRMLRSTRAARMARQER
jgi:DNA-binding transcriptional ArsR family regulator